MVKTVLFCLGLLSFLSTPALSAPVRAGPMAARHEELPATDLQDKRFHRPVHPLPVIPLPEPSKHWPVQVELPHPIKSSPIPLAPGPVLPRSAWHPSPSNVEEPDKVDPTRDDDTSPDRVSQLDNTHAPAGDLYRRKEGDTPTYSHNQDKKQHVSSDFGQDTSSPDEVSSTDGVSAFVEEIHRPAHGIYHRRASPSTTTPKDDENVMTEGDEILRQSLGSPEEAKANVVVVHHPKDNIFRRWRQSGQPDQNDDQDSRFETKLVVHQPAHNIYRRAAHAIPTSEIVQDDSKDELIHHLGHGPVVPLHSSKEESIYAEDIGEHAEKRNAQPIPPPEDFEEMTQPLSRRHSPISDIKDKHMRPPHTVPLPRPIGLPVEKLKARQPDSGAHIAHHSSALNNLPGNTADLHKTSSLVHRRSAIASNWWKDLTDSMHRVGETMQGSDRTKPAPQNGDSASKSGSDSASSHSSGHDRRDAAAAPGWKEVTDAIHRLGETMTGGDRSKPKPQNGDSAAKSGSDSASHSSGHDRRDAAPAPAWKDLINGIHHIGHTITGSDRSKPNSQNGDSERPHKRDTEPDRSLAKRVKWHLPATAHQPFRVVGRRDLTNALHLTVLPRKERKGGEDDKDSKDDKDDHEGDTPNGGVGAFHHFTDPHGVHRKPAKGKGSKDRRDFMNLDPFGPWAHSSDPIGVHKRPGHGKGKGGKDRRSTAVEQDAVSPAVVLPRKEKKGEKDDNDDEHEGDTPASGGNAVQHITDSGGVHKKPGHSKGKGSKDHRRSVAVESDSSLESAGEGVVPRRIPAVKPRPILEQREARKGKGGPGLPKEFGEEPEFLKGKGGVY